MTFLSGMGRPLRIIEDILVPVMCLFSALVVVVYSGGVLHNVGVVNLEIMRAADVPSTKRLLFGIALYGGLFAFSSYEMWKEAREYNDQ